MRISAEKCRLCRYATMQHAEIGKESGFSNESAIYSHRKSACESVIAGKIEKRTAGERATRHNLRVVKKNRERKMEKRNIA